MFWPRSPAQGAQMPSISLLCAGQDFFGCEAARALQAEGTADPWQLGLGAGSVRSPSALMTGQRSAAARER